MRIEKGLEMNLNPLFYWYARLDLNQRLSAPEADALSTELRALKTLMINIVKPF